MKRTLAALAVFGPVAFLGCGGGRPRGPVSDGERVYRSKCAACHRLYEPGERTRDQWESALAKMERLKKVRLTPEEEDLILGYLAGRPETPVDLPPAPAAQRR
ncbi:MAG: hypothetical protein NVS2B9_14110 [Myxococcales bacterium]